MPGGRASFSSKFDNISDEIQAAINVKTSLEANDLENALNLLFATTKVTRGWIQSHPEFVNRLFVATKSYSKIRKQNAVFLIGRKGSGKSTVANILPVLEEGKYKTCITILADHINLPTAFELIDRTALVDSLSEINERLAQHTSEYTDLNPLQFLFKYAWLGLLTLSLANEVYNLGQSNDLNSDQQPYYPEFATAFDEFTFNQSSNIESSRYFTFASVAFSEFWGKAVDTALQQETFKDAVRYLDSTVNEEEFLKFLLPPKVIKNLREIVRSCDKRALVTLDDFDTVFSLFRQKLRTSYNEDQFEEEEAKMLETDWVQSLMMLVLELKRVRSSGWNDELFSKLDFCVTIPKDSYAQVLFSDRDAFVNIESTADLEWTGVYLAQVLLKRICFIYNEDYDDEEDVFVELNRVLKIYAPKLPRTITFEFNNTNVTVDLFCYILRHSFWRPRDILTYYVALFDAASESYGKNALSVSQVRRIIGARTKNIIKTEFIGEFKESITNLGKTLNLFRGSKQILSYSDIFEKLEGHDLFVMPRGMVRNFHDKLEILYEIGFIGIQVPDEIYELENLGSKECFYFNEGSAFLSTLKESGLEDVSFIIHPVFAEELRLNHKENEFVMNFDYDYLNDNHVIRSSGVIDV